MGVVVLLSTVSCGRQLAPGRVPALSVKLAVVAALPALPAVAEKALAPDIPLAPPATDDEPLTAPLVR